MRRNLKDIGVGAHQLLSYITYRTFHHLHHVSVAARALRFDLVNSLEATTHPMIVYHLRRSSEIPALLKEGLRRAEGRQYMFAVGRMLRCS